MTFTLTIDVDNDAFRDDLGGEVARTLRVAADNMAGRCAPELDADLCDGRWLRDIHGNKVGEFSLREGVTA